MQLADEKAKKKRMSNGTKIGKVELVPSKDSFKIKVSPRESSGGIGVVISFNRSEAKALQKQLEVWLSGPESVVAVAAKQQQQ